MGLETFPRKPVCSASGHLLSEFPLHGMPGLPPNLHPPVSLTLFNVLLTSFIQALSLSLNVSSSKKSPLISSIPGLSAHQVPLLISIPLSTVAVVTGTRGVW